MSDLPPELQAEVDRRVAEELNQRDSKHREFTPFPEPKSHTDTPLVTWNEADYRCTGCGGPVPSGAWLHETVKDGMVVGLLVREGADGPVVHRCGVTDG